MRSSNPAPNRNHYQNHKRTPTPQSRRNHRPQLPPKPSPPKNSLTSASPCRILPTASRQDSSPADCRKCRRNNSRKVSSTPKRNSHSANSSNSSAAMDCSRHPPKMAHPSPVRPDKRPRSISRTPRNQPNRKSGLCPTPTPTHSPHPHPHPHPNPTPHHAPALRHALPHNPVRSLAPIARRPPNPCLPQTPATPQIQTSPATHSVASKISSTNSARTRPAQLPHQTPFPASQLPASHRPRELNNLRHPPIPAAARHSDAAIGPNRARPRCPR